MRDLTYPQMSRLDKLADEEDGTQVVGWHTSKVLDFKRLGPDEYSVNGNAGPIIRRQRNGNSRCDLAAYRFIDIHGRLKPLSKRALAEAGIEV